MADTARMDAIASAPPRANRWAIRLGSALIPVAHATGQNIVTVLGLRFMTDSLAISAGTAGLIFALVKIYDGVLDPAVGALSDRVRTPWGGACPSCWRAGWRCRWVS